MKITLLSMFLNRYHSINSIGLFLFLFAISSCSKEAKQNSAVVKEAIKKAQQEVFFEIQEGSTIGKLKLTNVNEDVKILNDSLLLVDFNFQLETELYPEPLPYWDLSIVEYGDLKYSRYPIETFEDDIEHKLIAPKLKNYFEQIFSSKIQKQDYENIPNRLSEFDYNDTNKYLVFQFEGTVEDVYPTLNQLTIESIDRNTTYHVNCRLSDVNKGKIYSIQNYDTINVVGLLNEAWSGIETTNGRMQTISLKECFVLEHPN